MVLKELQTNSCVTLLLGTLPSMFLFSVSLCMVCSWNLYESLSWNMLALGTRECYITCTWFLTQSHDGCPSFGPSCRGWNMSAVLGIYIASRPDRQGTKKMCVTQISVVCVLSSCVSFMFVEHVARLLLESCLGLIVSLWLNFVGTDAISEALCAWQKCMVYLCIFCTWLYLDSFPILVNVCAYKKRHPCSHVAFMHYPYWCEQFHSLDLCFLEQKKILDRQPSRQWVSLSSWHKCMLLKLGYDLS